MSIFQEAMEYFFPELREIREAREKRQLKKQLKEYDKRKALEAAEEERLAKEKEAQKKQEVQDLQDSTMNVDVAADIVRNFYGKMYPVLRLAEAEQTLYAALDAITDQELLMMLINRMEYLEKNRNSDNSHVIPSDMNKRISAVKLHLSNLGNTYYTVNYYENKKGGILAPESMEHIRPLLDAGVADAIASVCSAALKKAISKESRDKQAEYVALIKKYYPLYRAENLSSYDKLTEAVNKSNMEKIGQYLAGDRTSIQNELNDLRARSIQSDTLQNLNKYLVPHEILKFITHWAISFSAIMRSRITITPKPLHLAMNMQNIV